MTSAEAQEAATLVPASSALRVFLDCNPCDFDYLRREVPYVDYVRDRKDAELHILATTQGTGSGGTEYVFRFIGLGRFQGQDDELKFTAAQTDTGDERRRGYVRVIQLGLIRYVMSTPSADNLEVVYRPPRAVGAPVATPANDPWNYWSFRIRGSGSVGGETSSTSRNWSSSFTANRTTEAWKVNTSGNLNFRDNTYTLSDGEVITDRSHDHNANALVVKSLGPHWALAGRARVASVTFLNQDLATRVGGGIERSVFPYAQSSRRELVFQLTTNVNWFKYNETTIYGKDEETVADAMLLAFFEVRQPWGASGISFETAMYLHDPSRYRVVFNGDLEVRLFKGFSLSTDGSISRIHDQLYLPAGDATDEEILLRRRQLATSYRYRFSVGLSYTFGSIFNNIVNTRF